MKNAECIIEQYRGGKLVRTFTPSTDHAYPWTMNVRGKRYRRTHGWVLSKILPTLVAGSPFMTRVVATRVIAGDSLTSRSSQQASSLQAR
jgi:hypothetical protein